MPQMRFMADTEHAVIIGKRGQHTEKIFRRCIRLQFGTGLGLLGTTQRFLRNVGGLPGPEEWAAQELCRADAEPGQASYGFVCFLDTLSGQRTRVILLLPVSPINGNTMSE